ncbi:BglG family transcription antiterminator [Caproiciproducens sp.]|uniref:BglG family transcription antiterminator n=1 Tax=Caproiciproducens sp. TaxID=1954376 RepID=UPI00289BE8B7|nr:PRD domain-containing protein [Caproiciproducens sp.]
MTFTPRLNHLFRILLKNTEPVSVSELASLLNTSKRTLFRDMENVDSLLRSFHLRINAKSGVGIRLEGNEKDKETLAQALLSEEEPEPMDKENRRKRLILEILKNESVQKLYYYSNLFKVSEGTVSNDMDVIAGWFRENDLDLSRRQGYGVALEGTEEAYRRALSQFIYENISRDEFWEASSGTDGKTAEEIDIYPLLDTKIFNQVVAALKTIPSRKLERFTESSRIRLVIYLSVAAERILKQKKIFMETDAVQKLKATEDYLLAGTIADTLEESFRFKICDEERAYICIHIKSAKQKYIDKNPDDDFYIDHYELIRMIYRMIDRFDPEIAEELKTDEVLLSGLIVHLDPTLIRLRHNMAIQNSMLDQIRNMYPDIFEKSRNAAQVIWESCGFTVPDTETGYLATHFGAAVMRLKERKIRRRVVSIGVVCASGIGISYLMSSRIKNTFKADVLVKTYAQEDLAAGSPPEIDILVSSFPLKDVSYSYLLVSPLPTDEDLEKIRREINRRAYVETGQFPPERKSLDSSGHLHKTWDMAESIQSVLSRFDISYTDESTDFTELAEQAGRRFGDSDENRKLIFDDLLAREKISSQVVDSYQFALLHAKTDGVANPVFAVILPDHPPFGSEYLKGAVLAVVMLIPKGSGGKEHSQMMGKLSSALIEDEGFLNALKSGNREVSYAKIQEILEEYFAQKIKELYL